jgi:hypothetical protein
MCPTHCMVIFCIFEQIKKRMIMKDLIMRPKIWLIVIAVMHTIMGVISTYVIIGNTDNLALIIQFAFIFCIPIIRTIFD